MIGNRKLQQPIIGPMILCSNLNKSFLPHKSQTSCFLIKAQYCHGIN